jgi:hypothetical protein
MHSPRVPLFGKVSLVSLAIAVAGLAMVRCSPSSTSGGGAPTVERTTSALTYAGSILREGDVGGGAASLIAGDALEHISGASDLSDEGGWFVTAQKGAAGTAIIQSWGLADNGSLAGVQSWGSEFAVTKVAVTGMGLHNFVVGTIEKSGLLVLRSFEVDDNGVFSNDARFEAESVTDFAMTRMPQADPSILQIAVVMKRPDTSYKTVVYSIDAAGAFTPHRADTGGTVKGLSIVAPLQPLGVLVTPVLTSSSRLKLISYSVNAAGDVTRVSSLSPSDGVVSSLSSTAVGFGRFAVADTEVGSDGIENVWVRTFGIDRTTAMVSQGALGQASTSGPKQSLALVAGGGARLFLTGGDRSGNLQIRGFDVANNNTVLTETATAGAGAVGPVAAFVIKASRLITPVIASTGNLKTIAWRDYGMPMVKGFWPEAFGNPLTAAAPKETLATFAKDSGLSYVADLTIAVGDTYVVAGAYNAVAFYDKSGTRLDPKHDNVPTKVSLATLFGPIWNYAKADGSVNYDNLERYLEFQYVCDPEVGTAPGDKCPIDFYDSSVRYDAPSRRFVIQSQFRKGVGSKDPTARYVMLAVSRTDDPRDGFFVYGATESVLRDMPQLGTGAGMVMVTWNGGGDSSLRPTTFLFDINDLSVGRASPHVNRLARSQTDNIQSGFLPLNVTAATVNVAAPIAAVGRNRETYIDVWTFKKDFAPPVETQKARISWPLALGSDAHPHLPRATMRLASSSAGVFTGILTSVGTDRAVVDINQVTVQVDTNRTPTALTAVTNSSTIAPCMDNFVCRLPVLVVDNAGVPAIIWGQDGNPLTTTPVTWFSVHYRYPFTGTDLTLQPGGSQLDRGDDMDFVEGAPDPKTGGVWAIYKYAKSSGSYGTMIGRMMR